MLPSDKFTKPWLYVLTLVMSASAGFVVLCLITGALRDPTRSLHGVLGSMVWMTLGPHLVLLGLFALVFACLGFRMKRSRIAGLNMALSIAAFLGSLAITVRIVTTVLAAGGSVNPVRGYIPFMN